MWLNKARLSANRFLPLYHLSMLRCVSPFVVVLIKRIVIKMPILYHIYSSVLFKINFIGVMRGI